ncbi:hypothetical protein B0H10DRAFT_799546 [Mycena sp. CBHHK59/15]|nr:hypothetical protein B0H10DRAFT_799546 [Mycena sp. CBHHK59/15]
MVHPAFSTFPETLFFAAPSTSGLVTQFQRPEKARIFAEMRTVVENLKVGSLSTSGMTAISPPPQLAQDPFLEPIVAHKSTNSFDPGLLKLEVDDTDATDTLEREE